MVPNIDGPGRVRTYAKRGPRAFPRGSRLRTRGPAALIAALVAAAVAYWSARQNSPNAPTHGNIIKAVDGDTLYVQADGAKHTIRLIGVDTPEVHDSDKLERDVARTGQDRRTIQAMGRRAHAFTRSLCEGRDCRLDYDPANAASSHRDRYGRLLAYVYIPGEGGQETLLNAEIIRQGYGAAMTAYPFDDARKAHFLSLQREARAAGRGLWAEWKEREGQ